MLTRPFSIMFLVALIVLFPALMACGSDVAPSTPTSDVATLAAASDVAPSTPTSDVATLAAASDVAPSTPTSDVATLAAASDVAPSTPTSDVAPSTPTSDVAPSTPASEVSPPMSPRPPLAQTSEETDREVLIAFYKATDGPNWKAKINWLSDAPIGEWYGVTTDGDGRVVKLSLRQNRLSGEIPPELGNLANLTGLNLGVNGLSGEIPSELGKLVNLRWIQLDLTLLSGGYRQTWANSQA